MTLHPLGGSSAAQSFAYWGDRESWLVALSQHRDSDALERSNWQVISEDLLARFPDDVEIERFSNWAVGWNETLLVRPGTPAAGAAEKWADKLDGYPVADEDHFGMLEFGEEWCVRCDRGIRNDHPLNGCQFRDEDEADEIRWRWRNRHTEGNE